MISRKQHMADYSAVYGDDVKTTAVHRAYYAQFVDDKVRELVLRHIGRTALLSSTKEAFNDIPLSRWDVLVSRLGSRTVDKLVECGDWLSLGTGICILKEAAQQIVERATKMEEE